MNKKWIIYDLFYINYLYYKINQKKIFFNVLTKCSLIGTYMLLFIKRIFLEMDGKMDIDLTFISNKVFEKK